MTDERQDHVHRAVIDASNWVHCTCNIGEDHRMTYKLTMRDWA